MSYRRFLKQSDQQTLPWLGGSCIFAANASYRLVDRPDEYGWYRWTIRGRRASSSELAERPEEFNHLKNVKGYLVGQAIVPDGVAVLPDDIDKAIQQARPVFLIEDGLPRFCRISAVEWFDGQMIFWQQDFGLGSEDEVQIAYEDRAEDLNRVADVPPALDLAFRWESLRRQQIEERRQQIEQERQQRERIEAEAARYQQARASFETAAYEALRRAGAELLDWQRSVRQDEAVVTYRFRNRRFQCVCNMGTLRIVDAGFCLSGRGGRGDARFTLESLPAVLQWVLDEHGGLHITRHVNGDDSVDSGDDW